MTIARTIAISAILIVVGMAFYIDHWLHQPAKPVNKSKAFTMSFVVGTIVLLAIIACPAIGVGMLFLIECAFTGDWGWPQ